MSRAVDWSHLAPDNVSRALDAAARRQDEAAARQRKKPRPDAVMRPPLVPLRREDLQS